MGMFGDYGDASTMIGQGPALLDKANNVLDLILEALDTRIDELAVTNIASDPGLQKDFPTPGSQRWIVHRLASGGTVEVPAGGPTDLLKANVNRLGGKIVNFGEKTVILTLASAATDNAQEGLAEIALPVGAAWDFKLSGAVWCGEINGEPIGGTGKLTVAEV